MKRVISTVECMVCGAVCDECEVILARADSGELWSVCHVCCERIKRIDRQPDRPVVIGYRPPGARMYFLPNPKAPVFLTASHLRPRRMRHA